jgi:hypothetical protein
MLGRILLTLLCVIQGVATAAIDLNRTHATHPRWPAHARFHVVWQVFTAVLLAVGEVVLVWTGFFAFALALTAISPVAFLLAWGSKRTYGGELYDPDGIPPAAIELWGRCVTVDLNMVAVVAAVASLGVIALIYRG